MTARKPNTVAARSARGDRKRTPAPMARQAVLAGAAVLSAGVAIASYRYVARTGPVPRNIADNCFVDPWIIVHAGAAATALLLGPQQFLPPIRRRWPIAHRWTGRTYVASCLVGGASALVLAAGGPKPRSIKIEGFQRLRL